MGKLTEEEAKALEQAQKDMAQARESQFASSEPKKAGSLDFNSRLRELMEAAPEELPQPTEEERREIERKRAERDHERELSRLESRGFPARHVRKLDFMHGPGLERAKELSERVRSGDCLLVLCGDRGPGKTQIATYWALGSHTPRYYKAHDLIRTIRGEFSDNRRTRDESEEILVGARSCSYLVIDEFSELAGSDYEKRTLTNIIDHRYDGLKTTIIITNAPEAEVSDEVGRSIYSRCSEVGGIVNCDWESYR